MGKLVTKQQGLFLVFLLILIGLGEYAVHHIFHVPAWPAFFIMVLFFVEHRDIKMAPKILFGSAFGLLNLLIVKAWYGLTVPLLGGDLTKYLDPLTQSALWEAKVLYIFLFVTLILIFKNVLPWIFNDFAFLVFLASAAVSNANTSAMLAAKAIAGTAMKVAAEGGNTAAVPAIQAATDKVIAALVPTTNVLQWISIELIGGAALIAAMHGIAKLVALIMPGDQPNQSASH